MRIFLVLILLTCGTTVLAQTDATQELHEEYDGAFTLFFYKSTLRMLNMKSTQEYYEMVKDIEKAKFINISRDEDRDYQSDLKEYQANLNAEGYEAIMTMRYDGNDMNIYEREEDGESQGMVLVVFAPDYWIILDILGRFDMQNASKLIGTIQSFDIDAFNFD